MYGTLVKYLSVFLVSMVKFFGGPAAGVAMQLSFLETVLVSVAGMMTSVVLFSTVGIAVNRWYQGRRKEKQRVFSKRNRRVVKIWKTFGMGGIAFLTPLIFSPILGTIFAVILGAPRNRIFFTMLWSALFWGVVYTFGLSLLNNASFWDNLD